MKVILEFNQEQQMFHYNPIINDSPKDQENRFGWRTLLICKDEKQASLFAEFLNVQHLAKGEANYIDLKYTLYNLNQFLSYYK